MVVLMGKSSINGPFSMAMLNNQRVCVQWSVLSDFLADARDAEGECWWPPHHQFQKVILIESNWVLKSFCNDWLVFIGVYRSLLVHYAFSAIDITFPVWKPLMNTVQLWHLKWAVYTVQGQVAEWVQLDNATDVLRVILGEGLKLTHNRTYHGMVR